MSILGKLGSLLRSKVAVGILIAAIGGTIAAISASYYLHHFGPGGSSPQAATPEAQLESDAQSPKQQAVPENRVSLASFNSCQNIKRTGSNTLHKSAFDLIDELRKIPFEIQRNKKADSYVDFKIVDCGYFSEITGIDELHAEITEDNFIGASFIELINISKIICRFDISWQKQLYKYKSGKIIFYGTINSIKVNGPYREIYLSDCEFHYEQ